MYLIDRISSTQIFLQMTSAAYMMECTEGSAMTKGCVPIFYDSIQR